MNSIKDDDVSGRLKFVNKGEENQGYEMSIPDLMEQAIGVDKEADERQKKRKMKGIATDFAAEELLNLKKGTKKSREYYILQQIPKGSSEVSGIKLAVPDELKSKSKGSSKGAGITPKVPDEPKGKSVTQDID
nr:hypothetical protein [Tanacetum cinerariifolium]